MPAQFHIDLTSDTPAIVNRPKREQNTAEPQDGQQVPSSSSNNNMVPYIEKFQQYADMFQGGLDEIKGILRAGQTMKSLSPQSKDSLRGHLHAIIDEIGRFLPYVLRQMGARKRCLDETIDSMVEQEEMRRQRRVDINKWLDEIVNDGEEREEEM
ncbi:hypothetical protein CBS101457_002916 [Exobasidium rhododendri]|nr:hypothetical protein CBS101457_002916 [Exobasidium rhododendri]